MVFTTKLFHVPINKFNDTGDSEILTANSNLFLCQFLLSIFSLFQQTRCNSVLCARSKHAWHGFLLSRSMLPGGEDRPGNRQL